MKTQEDSPDLRPLSVYSYSASASQEVAWPVVARKALHVAAMSAIIGLVVWSAILAKAVQHARPLAEIRVVPVGAPLDAFEELRPDEPPITFQDPTEPAAGAVTPKALDENAFDPEVRWFNGRPAKPARSIWMTVTAYSPDARSCGECADGLTATLHSVYTNGFKLVAADPTILPYGSMVTVQGYDRGAIVPVLDCGSAIKGQRLDVLFPTHEQARAWGVRKIKVTVWKYSDGKAAENPRKVR